MSLFSISFSIPCLPAAFTGLFSPHDLAQKHSQPTQLKLVFHLQSDLTLRGSWRYSSAGENLTGLKKKKKTLGSRSHLYFAVEVREKMSHFATSVCELSDALSFLSFGSRLQRDFFYLQLRRRLGGALCCCW